jgi:hypothetical protein
MVHLAKGSLAAPPIRFTMFNGNFEDFFRIF